MRDFYFVAATQLIADKKINFVIEIYDAKWRPKLIYPDWPKTY